MAIKSIDEFVIEEKALLLRTDFDHDNSRESKEILDYKIDNVMPTVNHILENRCRLVIASHRSLPKRGYDKAYSLEAVAGIIGEKISKNIYFPDNCVGDAVKKIKNEMRPGEVMMLENLMFHPSEAGNDTVFAKKLADSVDIYVNEAFSLIDNNFASNNAVLSYIPEKCAGFSFINNLSNLDRIKNYEGTDLAVYFGGNDIGLKLEFLESYMDRIKFLVLGGNILYTFLYSLGYSINRDCVDLSSVYRMNKLHSSFKTRNKKILVPEDFLISTVANKKVRSVEREKLMDNMIIKGFGNKTVAYYENQLKNSDFMLWDGSLGLINEYDPDFEHDKILPSLVNSEGFVILLSDFDMINKNKRLYYSDRIACVMPQLTSYKYLLGHEFESLARLENYEKNNSSG